MLGEKAGVECSQRNERPEPLARCGPENQRGVNPASEAALVKNATGNSLPTPRDANKKPLHFVRLRVPDLGAQTGPTLSPVLAMHRGPDGFVPFGAKPNGEWTELGAMDLSQPWLPELVTHLQADAYFGLNSSFRTGVRPTVQTRHAWRPIPNQPGAEEYVPESHTTLRRTNPTTGLPYASHTSRNMRWLNVCHVDVDCYKAGLTVGDALGAIVNLQDAGQLPTATAFARSGRGLWVFWFLVDAKNPQSGEEEIYGARHRPDTPQRASTRAVALYARVQRALADTLAHLGADLGALDAARFAPVPGTLKTAVQRRADYWLQVDAQRRAFAYRLDDLAHALGIETIPASKAHPALVAALPDTDTPKNATLQDAGRRGWLVRWRHALADFHVLLNLRGGGFTKGIRNRGAFFYALLLRRGGMDWHDVERHVRVYGLNCTPQLGADEVKNALRQARRPKERTGFLTYDRMVRELLVTDVEASYFSFLRPQAKALAPKFRTVEARRAAIVRLVAQLGAVPSPRAMVPLLDGLGFTENHTTVWRDYNELGFTNKRKHDKGGRPPTLPY